MPFSLAGHKWPRLFVAAIVLYLLLIPVWLVLLKVFVVATAAVADFFYGLFDSSVRITSAGDAINVSVRAVAPGEPMSQAQPSGLSMSKVTYGLPLFAALALVTRSESLRAKSRSLIIGLLVMSLTSVLAVMMWAKMTGIQLEEGIAKAGLSNVGDRSSFFYYAFHGYAFSQPVLAVAVWLALMMLGMFNDKRKAGQSEPVARNGPCPCGSRRKYKRCCGRA